MFPPEGEPSVKGCLSNAKNRRRRSRRYWSTATPVKNISHRNVTSRGGWNKQSTRLHGVALQSGIDH